MNRKCQFGLNICCLNCSKSALDSNSNEITCSVIGNVYCGFEWWMENNYCDNCECDDEM